MLVAVGGHGSETVSPAFPETFTDETDGLRAVGGRPGHPGVVGDRDATGYRDATGHAVVTGCQVASDPMAFDGQGSVRRVLNRS